MDVSLEYGGVSTRLIGAGISAPVRAGKIDLTPTSPYPPLPSFAGPKRQGREEGGEGTTAAVVELALDGTAAQIASFQQGLEKALYLATLGAGQPGEDQGYLKVTLADSTSWLAPVRSGRCAVAKPGPGARGNGSQGLLVALELEGYWESATVTDVPLTNKYGAGVTAGIQVDNHDDAGHDNFVNIAAGVILGDVPAPATVTLTSATQSLDVMLAEMVNYPGSFNAVVEGEAWTAWGPATLTPTADAGGCSGGNYGAFAWNGTAAARLAYAWDAANTGYLGGKIYRPVLRLRDLVTPGEKIWVNCVSGFNNGAAWLPGFVGDGIALPTDSRLVVFPPVPIPPWPKPPAGFNWEPGLIYLDFSAEAAGAHAINIDFLLMMPCDGWLRFLPIYAGLATSIRYEGGTGLITRATTGMASHAPDGPGLVLFPGASQKIYFIGQSGSAADIAYNITLKLQYRARKRVL